MAVFKNDEQIDIAMEMRFAARIRAEQNDFERIELLRDLIDSRLDLFLGDHGESTKVAQSFFMTKPRPPSALCRRGLTLHWKGSQQNLLACFSEC